MGAVELKKLELREKEKEQESQLCPKKLEFKDGYAKNKGVRASYYHSELTNRHTKFD